MHQCTKPIRSINIKPIRQMQTQSCADAIMDIRVKIEENQRRHNNHARAQTKQEHEMHEIRDPHGILNVLDVSCADTLESMRSRL